MTRRSCRLQIRKNSESEKEDCEEKATDGKSNTKENLPLPFTQIITTPVPKEIITSPVKNSDSKKDDNDDDDDEFETSVKKRTTSATVARSARKKKSKDVIVVSDVDLSTEDGDDELENKITAPPGRSSRKEECNEELLYIGEEDELEIQIAPSKRKSQKTRCGEDDAQHSAQESEVEGDVNTKISKSSRSVCKTPSDREQLSTEENVNDSNFQKNIKTPSDEGERPELKSRSSCRKTNEEAQYSTEEEEEILLENLKKRKSTPSRGTPTRSRDTRKTTPSRGTRKTKNEEEAKLPTLEEDAVLEMATTTKKMMTTPARSNRKKPSRGEEDVTDSTVKKRMATPARSNRKTRSDDEQLSTDDEGHTIMKKRVTTPARSNRKMRSDDEQLSTEDEEGTTIKNRITTPARSNRKMRSDDEELHTEDKKDIDTTSKTWSTTPARNSRKRKPNEELSVEEEEGDVFETNSKKIVTYGKRNRKKRNNDKQRAAVEDDMLNTNSKKKIATHARNEVQLSTEDEDEDEVLTNLRTKITTPSKSSCIRMKQCDEVQNSTEEEDNEPLEALKASKDQTLCDVVGKETKLKSESTKGIEEVEEQKKGGSGDVEEKEEEIEGEKKVGDVEEKEEAVVNDISGSDEIGLSEGSDRTKHIQCNEMLEDSVSVAQDVEDASVHGAANEDKNAADSDDDADADADRDAAADDAAAADDEDVAADGKDLIDEGKYVVDEKGDVTDDDEDGADGDEDGTDDDDEDGADDDEDGADDDDEDGADDDDEDGADDDESDASDEEESADDNEATAKDHTAAEPPPTSVIENPVPINVISCPKPQKRTFNIDRSKYENDLFNKFASNPLMQSMCELKNNNLFKDFMKSKRTDTKDDVLSLDSVTLANETHTHNDKFKLSSLVQTSMKHELYIDTATGKSNQIDANKNVERIMKKSVLADDLESMERAPKLFKSKNSTKIQSKKERDETAGKGWYNLPRTEVTDKIKNDLQLIKMRNVLDSKHHYKRNDTNKLPKYFQMGTIVEGAHEFYSARIPKKKRKGAMVDELLADAEFRRKNKRKYIEIRKKQLSGGKGFYKKQKNKGKKPWERT